MPVVRSVPQRTAGSLSVCVVESQGLADLCVYRAESASEAKWSDAVWQVVDEGRGDTSVHFTDTPARADLRVHFVSDKTLSGWMKRHPLKGRLSRRR